MNKDLQEKIDFIDQLLIGLEDFTHGKLGEDITKSRKLLSEIIPEIERLEKEKDDGLIYQIETFFKDK